MTDPGIEAARKATEGKVSHFIGPGRYALIGAREALGPVRAWYERQTQMWCEGVGGLSPLALKELAPLIFAGEELGR